MSAQPTATPIVPAAMATTAPTLASTLAPTTVPTHEPPTIEPTATPISEPVGETPQLSFVPATYTDEGAGFALDYPAEWTVESSSPIGVRGGQALLLSPGATAETLAEGGTRIALIRYIWDPKHDLEAYVAQRKVAWDASGFTVSREEAWSLADGRAAYIFILNTPERPSFTLLTTIGEDYLQIAGDGDLSLAEEIARTLRPASRQ